MEPLAVVAARRDHARREWESGTTRPQLWTSAARCAACGEPGVLLEAEGDDLFHVCLSCGERRTRRTRG